MSGYDWQPEHDRDRDRDQASVSDQAAQLAEELRAWARDLADKKHHDRCNVTVGGECDCYKTRRAIYRHAQAVLDLGDELEAVTRERGQLREAVLDGLVSFPDTKWAESYQALAAAGDRQEGER